MSGLPVGRMLAVDNPATGERLAELAVDDASTIAAKVASARAAQADWARRPLVNGFEPTVLVDVALRVRSSIRDGQ